MGVVEIQIFVSLLVILGAAFVALICDFLKGSNEQLRESNIELRVRADERDKRDALVQEVRRQTIEAVTQVRKPVAEAAAGTAEADAAFGLRGRSHDVRGGDPQGLGVRSLFEPVEQHRQGRRRRERTNEGEAASGLPLSPAAWAQEAFLRHYPHGDPARRDEQATEAAMPAAVPEAMQPEVQEDIRIALERAKAQPASPAVAGAVPLTLEPAASDVAPHQVEAVAEPVAGAETLLPGFSAEPLELETAAVQETAATEPAVMAEAQPILMEPVSGTVLDATAAVDAVSLSAEAGPVVPEAGLQIEAEPVAEVAEAEPEEQPEIASNVVRIRVLSEDELAVEAEAAGAEAAEPAAAAEAPEAVEVAAEVISEVYAAEPAAIEAQVEEPATTAARSNVVEMPAGPAPRAVDAEAAEAGELSVPGGYHEPQALARLLEEPGAYRGLVLVVSLVDYVRLLADQGKPAMEQLMASISRLVVSLTREQDFACRIAEDEFVLLFVKEMGPAAKRRIQMVSERLWDFQLRSLGSISLIFSWGAMESNGKSLAEAVDGAREQMLETRQNRRSLATGTGRFRRAAND